MLFSHYLHKLCDEIKFEQRCPLSLMGTISLTIAQIVVLSTKPLNGLRQFKRLNSWGGCMQPQVSQIGRRLHLSELKNRERQSHFNEIVTRLVEIRFTIK